ncbi:MAG: glycosyltransferase [Chloroflexi bacterium]|nr:MAG: glycosyltransferase [Chloroflexota bacterium]
MNQTPTQAPDEVTRLVAERSKARGAGNFEEADRLRDRIRDLGWEVMDGPDGTALRPALPSAADASVAYARPEDLASLLEEAPSLEASLVVLADDHGDDLDRLLRGLSGHPPLASWELIVVGNAPAFDPFESLARVDLEIEPSVLSTSARLGWADTVNLGLRRCRGQVIVLLDNSVEPLGDFLAPLLKAFTDPRVGIAGPFGVSSTDLRQFDEAPPGEVDAIEGYCLAVRREVLRDVGLFDAHFRFYRNADLDFSFAIRAAGWRAVRTGELPLQLHEHRGWASLPAEERDRMSKRNFYRFLKHWGDRRDLLTHPGPRRTPKGDRS